MKNNNPGITCDQAVESIRFFMEGELPTENVESLQAHLKTCKKCQKEFNARKGVLSLLGKTYGQKKISEEFDHSANQKLAVMYETGKQVAMKGRAKAAPDAEPFLDGAEEEKEGRVAALAGTMGAAPWWVVSVMLHALVIALAGLISMAVSLPAPEDAVIMVTELAPRPKIEEIELNKEKKEVESALHSKHETPPTDPTSKEVNDIVVPPEILAKAELGDHFETINPDRPDTQSAFGNPEAHMFHSVQGNDEPEGGGGTGGATLDDMIGVGGAGSPGTGGGWGGGNGTGIGVGNGSGRGSFGNRNGGGRKLMVKRHGGSAATEGAVEKALDWLARHQEADGSWSVVKTEGDQSCKGCDPGVTGLAVLAFLGAGHTEKIGKYKEVVRKGIAWIVSQQGADGGIGAKWIEHHGGFGYNHAICGLALAEAYGMARIPETKIAAQKAMDYTCNLYQHGEGSDKLGWRYSPKAAVGDMSVSGWFIMQLKSGKIAGLGVDHFSFEGALKFMATREQDPAKVTKENDGYDTGRHRYGYTEKGAMVNTTSIGVLCQLFCGTKVEELQGAAAWLLRTNPPAWDKDLGTANGGGWPMYYTYYTTLVMFQCGGDLWKKWNEGMKKMLLDNQRKGGDPDGSWDPLSAWETKAGRAYTTALGALSLEVYYRYMKLGGSH